MAEQDSKRQEIIDKIVAKAKELGFNIKPEELTETLIAQMALIVQHDEKVQDLYNLLSDFIEAREEGDKNFTSVLDKKKQRRELSKKLKEDKGK